MVTIRMSLLMLRTARLLVALAVVGGLAWWRDPAVTRVAVRRLLERGGVTTIKIGQYLAIRRDLLSAAMCAELSRLFDAVPAMTPAIVRDIIERELGGPVERFFVRFDWAPIGAASIAQVHRARTQAGALVAIKVQRPGLAARLGADFRMLGALATLGDRLGLFGTMSAAELVDEIAAFTLREVDFRVEGNTAERIAADSGRGVHVPAIHWRLSTERLLVMEFIDAVPLARVIARADAGDADAFEAIAPGIDAASIADALARAFLRQLFVTGVFHGDPHPANVLVKRDGGIALIDFGIFGRLGTADRALMAGYVENLALGRFDAAFDCYAGLVHAGPRTDMAAFRRAAIAVLTAWHGAAGDPATPVALQLTARYQGIMFAVMREHQVRMDTQHLLFWRALGMLDATAHRLPGRFDLLAAIRGFFAENRPPLAQRTARASARLLESACSIAPDAVGALATVGDRRLRIDSRMAADQTRADAMPARLMALALAEIALVIHAATLAPAPSMWPVAFAAAIVLAMAPPVARSRHVS